MEDPAPPVRVEALLAHREWVRRVARALVRDENAADDLEQEVWVEALEKPPRSGRSLGGWFTSALRHNLVDRKRSEAGRRRREEGRALPEAVPSAAELVAKADAHRRVVVALMDLPEPYRTTVLYRFFEDLGPGEAAARMGVPVETFRTRLRRALELLRARLAEGEGGERRALAFALAPLLGERGTGPAVAGAAASSAAGAAILGGILMSKKAVAAGVAVLFVLGVLGFLVRDRAEAPRETAEGRGGGIPSATPSTGTRGADPVSPPSPRIAGGEAAAVREVASRWLPVMVTDEAGAAVPGTTVLCLAGDDGTPFSEEAVADDGGNLSIRVPADAECRLVARAKGFADTTSRVLPTYPKVLVFLKGTRFLAGTVVDAATGRPVPATPVRIFAEKTASQPGARTWEAVTSKDGTFRREGLPPGKFVLAAGSWAGNPTEPYEEARIGPVDADAENLRIAIRAFPALAGVVLDETGAPFRGSFEIRARTWEADRTPGDYVMPFLNAGEEDAGRFRIRPVEPGRYDVVVRPLAPGNAPQPYAGAVLRRVPSGSEDLEFRLVRGLAIEGRAVDTEGNPLENVGIRVFGPDGEEVHASMGGPGRDGQFTSGLLDPRHEYDLLFQQFTPNRPGRLWMSALVKGVRPGTRELKVVFAPSPPISGRLLDAAGAPAEAGVPVTAQSLDFPRSPLGITVTGYTAADGTFAVPGIGAPGDLRFRLTAGGGGSRLAPRTFEGPFRTGDRDIVLRLTEIGERLDGTVRFPTGLPGRNMKLTARPPYTRQGELEEPWFVQATADAEGQFRLEGVPRGSVALWAEHEGRSYNCGVFEAPSSGVKAVLPTR
jgi:RNA polymerase sigma-70 factor (ECF subfamily)